MTRHRKIHNDGNLLLCARLSTPQLKAEVKGIVALLWFISSESWLHRPCIKSPDDKFLAFWAGLHVFQLQSPNEKFNDSYYSPLSSYLAILDHKYCTAILDRAQSVGDGDAGPSLLSAVQGAQNTPLALCVQSRGGLVKQQDRWVSDQCPCNGDPLLLTWEFVFNYCVFSNSLQLYCWAPQYCGLN